MMLVKMEDNKWIKWYKRIWQYFYICANGADISEGLIYHYDRLDEGKRCGTNMYVPNTIHAPISDTVIFELVPEDVLLN